jgi:ParB-like chromosome segregation protein Spo0J
MTEVVKPNIAVWDIERVTPYDLNAKTHDEAQVRKIAKSIQDFGWDQPIVVDKAGVIIKGHGRRLGALSLGMKKVPVWVRDDLTDAQVRASRLADNRVAISNLDTDILQRELASLEFDLDGFFDKKELEFMVADLGELNTDAFVADLESAIADQAVETTASIIAAGEKDVAISKALGFKSVKGADERAIAMFMAQIEAESGKTGAEAFMEFIRPFAGVNKSPVIDA